MWSPQPGAPEPGRGAHVTPDMKTSWDSVHQGETGACEKSRCPFKEPAHKISFLATNLGLGPREGNSEQTGVKQRGTGLCGPKEKTEGSAAKVLC